MSSCAATFYDYALRSIGIGLRQLLRLPGGDERMDIGLTALAAAAHTPEGQRKCQQQQGEGTEAEGQNRIGHERGKQR